MEKRVKFTWEEKHEVLNIVSNFKTIINRRGDRGKTKLGSRMWDEIATIYNAGNPLSGSRTAKQLCKLVKNLRRLEKLKAVS